ncbi:hypothetical protein ACOME3_000680 [Neoechinorhynchus agilis]
MSNEERELAALCEKLRKAVISKKPNDANQSRFNSTDSREVDELALMLEKSLNMMNKMSEAAELMYS